MAAVTFTSSRYAKLAALSTELEGKGAWQALRNTPGQVPHRIDLSFTVDTVTPALLGGADPRASDRWQPVRAKAVRGQLRAWWRLLAASGDLDAELRAWRSTLPAVADLPACERTLWGSVHGDVAYKSPIALWVDAPPPSDSQWAPYEDENPTAHRSPPVRPEFKPFAYALEFARAAKEADVPQASRVLLHVGYRFSLHLRLDCPELRPMVLKCLLAWSRFGGIGSRTARGLGAVQLRGFDPSAALPQVANRDWKAVQICSLGPFSHKEGFSAPQRAVAWGLATLRDFMQGSVGRNRPEAMPSAHDSKRPGRSRWPEADAIRRAAGVYFKSPAASGHAHPPTERPNADHLTVPRLAFGHRSIRFKNDQAVGAGRDRPNLDPAPRLLAPQGCERLPSSVLIRAWPSADGSSWNCDIVRLRQLADQMREMAIPIPGAKPNTPPARVWLPNWSVGVPGGCDRIPALEDERLRNQKGRSGYPNVRDAGQAFCNFAVNRCADGHGGLAGAMAGGRTR